MCHRDYCFLHKPIITYKKGAAYATPFKNFSERQLHAHSHSAACRHRRLRLLDGGNDALCGKES